MARLATLRMKVTLPGPGSAGSATEICRMSYAGTGASPWGSVTMIAPGSAQTLTGGGGPTGVTRLSQPALAWLSP